MTEFFDCETRANSEKAALGHLDCEYGESNNLGEIAAESGRRFLFPSHLARLGQL
jgi:hypothetical protein